MDFWTNINGEDDIMKNETIFKLVMILLKIISIILAIISIYWIYLKITNHSPTLAEISIAISIAQFGIIVPALINIYKQLAEIKTTMKYEFRDIKKELKDHIERGH